MTEQYSGLIHEWQLHAERPSDDDLEDVYLQLRTDLYGAPASHWGGREEELRARLRERRGALQDGLDVLLVTAIRSDLDPGPLHDMAMLLHDAGDRMHALHLLVLGAMREETEVSDDDDVAIARATWRLACETAIELGCLLTAVEALERCDASDRPALADRIRSDGRRT